MNLFGRPLFASLALLVGLFQSPSLLAEPGDLDRAFGGDGTVLTNFHCLRDGSAVPRQDLRGIAAMVLAPDSKIVAAGTCARLEGSATVYRIALARYNADGTPDRSFRWDGVVDAANL
ncbi:MAG TPA: delta-60 repeat domain-containing protein [bacterium]|nr:delta-60 repeat domain-containing protein [bacterium]